MINEIQAGRYNGLLHKLLDMKEGAPAPTLATDVFPTLVLEADRPEWSFLKGEQLCMGYALAAAGGAGTYGKVALLGAAPTGVLLVLERIMLYSTSSSSISVRQITTGLLNNGTKAFRDSRSGWAGSSVPGGRVTYVVDGTAPGTEVSNLAVLANSPLEIPYPTVLHSGNGICFMMNAANVPLTVALSWRERVLEQSETR